MLRICLRTDLKLSKYEEGPAQAKFLPCTRVILIVLLLSFLKSN